jgi:transcriptional regulator with XRE-family HTH domain
MLDGINIDARIAERVRELRAARGLSLKALAEKSGVSRSMISVIERGESSPTATVLEKLANGFDVLLPELFEPPASSRLPPSPVARRGQQPEWQDPASGYRRRNVSPPGMALAAHLVEIHFPAGARVALDSSELAVHPQQQVWVLEGAINITVGKARHALRQGDCLAMRLDAPVMFHNPTRKTTRYVVVISPHAPHLR